MSATDVATIKTALHTWVVRGSGLDDGHVIWTLGATSPTGPYIHLRLTIGSVGTDWIVNSINPTPTAGNAAVYTVGGNRQAKLTMMCFADDANGGARSPEQILNDVLTASTLPSISSLINAAKIGLTDFGPIVPVAGAVIDSVRFEPRAYTEVKFFTVAQLSETGPAITSVGVVADVTGLPERTFSVTT